MTKKLLISIVTLVLAFQITSCTSKKSSDDAEIVENADIEKIEAEDSYALSGDDGSGGLDIVEDPSLHAALGETTTTDLYAPEATTETVTTETTMIEPSENVAAAPSIVEDELPAPIFDETPVEPSSTVSTITEETTTTSSYASDDTGSDISETPISYDSDSSYSSASTESKSSSSSSYADSYADSSSDYSYKAPVAKAKGEPIKKIALTSPTQGDNGWVNTVYVARPKEKLKDISQKIYGMDKSSELKNISENSFLKRRAVKAGDKVYYVSPNRPTDSSKTLFYYEDVNVPASTYVAQKGDTLRSVGKKLLGYNDGWKELFTSNSVDTSGRLTAGEMLRYWEGGSSAPTTLASNTTHHDSTLIDAGQAQMPSPNDYDAHNMMPQETSFPPPPSGELPPPPTGDMAYNSMPDVEMSPPPPPPDLAPPPPPPVDTLASAPKSVPSHEEAEEGLLGGLDNDTMMSLGAVGVLTALLAFVLIRRKKKKAAEYSMHDETNVGT